MPVDASGTRAGLAALRARLQVAAQRVASQASLLVERAGMERTHVRTGTLRRSWKIDGPEGGDGTYSARVGPTMIYARRQELGFLPPLRDSLGRSFPHDYGWPYVKPAFDASIEPIRVLAVTIIGSAIRG